MCDEIFPHVLYDMYNLQKKNAFQQEFKEKQTLNI